jgi:hypothetical protein
MSLPYMSRNKLPLLLVCLYALLVGVNVVATSDEHFVYSGFAGASLTLDGAATITPAGLLELTNGTLRQKAHAVHPSPLRFRDNGTSPSAARSFSASFVFGILCPDPDACGHGIALFVAPGSYDLSSALPSQYMGLVNDTTNGAAADRLFGVELDTDQNNEFRDIDGNHAGVDVDSLVSVASASAGYYDDASGSFRNLTLASGEAMRVWVDYDGVGRRVNLTMAPLNTARPSKPLLSTAYDLSPVLADVAYVGFSSATGSFNSRHYVLGWSFAMEGPAPPIDTARLPKLPRFDPAKHGPKLAEIIPPTATAALILSLGLVAGLAVRRRLRYAELRDDWELEFGPHRFSYKDLFHATDGFKNKHLLGVGGFGRVYKGVLPASKLEVAVKKVSHDSKQGVREFVAEVVSIGRLQHRNLVQLLGYCRRKGELLLVYEYMSNGSLDKHLYGGDNPPPSALDWGQRFRIIRGVASGLLYLHEEWEKVVVHRDIKASNVLLDGEMNGRLGDFGLARLYDHGADPHTTHVVGTIGYLAPELGRTSKATPLTDVFAFGVFLLEVACGQRPIKQDSSQFVSLADWVVGHWNRGSLAETVDARLRGSYSVDEVSLVLKLGLMCSHPLSNARPTMRQVVKYLIGDMPLPELAPTQQSFQTLAFMQSQGFDSYAMSYPSSVATMATSMSNLSGVR